jgi:hypothetical protein
MTLKLDIQNAVGETPLCWQCSLFLTLKCVRDSQNPPIHLDELTTLCPLFLQFNENQTG